MNRIRRICRSLSGMPRRVGALFASAAAAPTALATAPPLPLGHVAGPAYKVPATIPAHTTVTGGMPGWQITLITATAVLLAAALALAVYRTRSRQEGPRPAAMIQLPKQPGHASAAAV